MMTRRQENAFATSNRRPLDSAGNEHADSKIKRDNVAASSLADLENKLARENRAAAGAVLYLQPFLKSLQARKLLIHQNLPTAAPVRYAYVGSCGVRG